MLLVALSNPVYGQKKKKAKKPKDPHSANILKRGYNDITTRNNYYFNANIKYKELKKDAISTSELDYDEILPLYFHDRPVEFSNYSGELEEIIKKTSLVLQLRDYTRWKDDCYVLLGKAQYLQGEPERALKTFQFVSTTMKKDVAKKGNTKNQKKAKKARLKEISKEAAEKKKEIEQKKKEKSKEIAEKVESAKKRQKDLIAAKKKAIAKKIKLKKKNIKRKKKGKPPLVYKEKKSVAEEIEEKKKEAQEKFEDEQQSEDDGFNYEQVEEDFGEEEELTAEDTVTIEDIEEMNFWEKIRHKPARPDAVMWMAKSFIAMGDFGKAKSLIKYVESLPKLSKKQQKELGRLESFFYISRDNYKQAIDPLFTAAAASKKKEKAYLLYVIGQLYEAEGDFQTANDLYHESLKAKGDYTLRFKTNMKIAELYTDKDLASDEEAMKILRKLLKDRTNKEFRDQVYFMIADLYQDRGDIDKAKEALLSSIRASKDNTNQKGLSYYRLGDLHFLDEDYILAYGMYDSSMSVIAKEFEHYDKLAFKKRVTEEVSEFTISIATQDSLLNLGLMSESDRNAYIAQQQKKLDKEEKKRKRRSIVTEEDGAIDPFFANLPNNVNQNVRSDGKWYFYNAGIKGKGFTEFRANWGDRKLEDNWRISSLTDEFSKGSFLEDSLSQEVDEIIEDEAVEIGKNKIPESEQEIKKLQDLIAEYHFELGNIFWSEVRNVVKAKNHLISSLKNKEADYLSKAHYMLYLIYSSEKDLINAENHRQTILTQFPNSQAAKTLQGVDENDNQISDQTFYASTYSMFEAAKYNDVISRRGEAEKQYPQSKLLPQFRFLEAMSLGHLNKVDELKMILSQIIVDHADEEIGKKAQEYMIFITKLQRGESSSKGKNTTDEEETTNGLYEKDWTSNILGMVYFEKLNVPIKNVIEKLEAYHSADYPNERLRVSNAYLDKRTQIILIKRFREFDGAKDYYTKLNVQLNDVLGSDVASKAELFLISQNNFRKLFESKELDEYKMFFLENL